MTSHDIIPSLAVQWLQQSCTVSVDQTLTVTYQKKNIYWNSKLCYMALPWQPGSSPDNHDLVLVEEVKCKLSHLPSRDYRVKATVSQVLHLLQTHTHTGSHIFSSHVMNHQSTHQSTYNGSRFLVPIAIWSLHLITRMKYWNCTSHVLQA